MKSLVGARYLANNEGTSGNACTLQFFRNGSTRVHWRKELTLRDETARGVLTLPSGIHGIECQGEGLTSWLVKHRRDATIVLLDFGPLGSRLRRHIEVKYNVDSRRIGALGAIYYFGPDDLPHVYTKWPSQLKQAQERSDESLPIFVEWEPGIQCFGLPLDPVSGHGSLRVSQAQLDDLQVHFGAFRLGMSSDGIHIWVPTVEVPGFSAEDLRVISTWAARVRNALIEDLGAAPCSVDHILAIPQAILVTIDKRLPGMFLGNTVRITDPRESTSEWTQRATVRLAMQLSHEMSHAWWVPITVPWVDDRAWGLAEAAATLSERLMLWRVDDRDVAQAVWYRAQVFHSALLVDRADEHRRRYHKGAGGLRGGYFLSAFVADQDKMALNALRRLFNVMEVAQPNTTLLDRLFEEALGTALGRQLLGVLTEPKPPVATVRWHHTAADPNPEILIQFSNRRDAQHFHEQLVVTQLSAKDILRTDVRGRAVVVTFKPGSDPYSLLPLLPPGFLVYKRDLQEERLRTNPVFGPLVKYANRSSAAPAGAFAGRGLRVLVGLVLIMVFSESPLGYLLAANQLRGALTPIAKWLKKAAVARGG
jgi:hypothetical protein